MGYSKEKSIILPIHWLSLIFDKSRVVNGTVARGALFPPSLLFARKVPGTKALFSPS